MNTPHQPVAVPPNDKSAQPACEPNSDHSHGTEMGRLTCFRAQLELLRSQTTSLDALILATSSVFQSIWTPIAIWSLSTNSKESDSVINPADDLQPHLTPRCLLDPLGDMAAWNSMRGQIERAIRETDSNVPVVEYQPDHFLMLVPYPVGNETNWLGGIFQRTKGSLVEAEASVIADHLNLGIQGLKVELLNRQSKSLAELIGVGAAMAQSESIEASCITLANRLRQMSDALQVVLVTKNKNQKEFRVAAISDVESFDEDSECTRKIRKAATLVEHGEPVQIWHSDMPEESIDRLTLKNYSQIHACDGCINIALTDKNQQVFAALLFAITRSQATDSRYIEYLKSICDRVSSQFHLVQLAQRKPTQVLYDWMAAQRKRRWFRIGAISMVVFLVAMLIPLPYQVHCDCEVQPVVRRFVAAPFEGLLEESLVHNGDMVTEGQLLARMDGRQLRMELAGLKAEFNGQKKMRDSALARGSVAESQIASKEMQRLESEIGLISGRFDNLEIRSPLKGAIVSGDLDKAQGAPLEMGQELFEVAPLQRMSIELSVPENEIQYIKPDMAVAVRLNAFPFQTFKARLLRIHARSEIRNEANVFVAEVELENSNFQLKPGMKGSATVRSTPHPLGWNLFHHSWDSVRRWMIW